MFCKNYTDITNPIKKLDNATKGVIIGAVVATTAVVVVPPILAVVGFAPTGIIGGSWAAGIQGSTIVAGSLFASCQSVASAGIALNTVTSIIASSGIVGGAVGKAIENTNVTQLKKRYSVGFENYKNLYLFRSKV